MRRPALGVAAVGLVWLLCGGAALLAQQALLNGAYRAVVKARPQDDHKTQEPVARHLCDGRLAQAEQALRQADTNPNVAVILRHCLRGIGRTDSGATDIVHFTDRLPLVLDSVLLAERRAGINSKLGCTPWQLAVMSEAFEQKLSVMLKFKENDLPINCMEGYDPLWWRAVVWLPKRKSMSDLLLLQELGVNWHQRSTSGETLLQHHEFLTAASHMPNASLRFLLERATLPDTDLSVLRIDFMRRRFDKFLRTEDRKWLQTVSQRAGDPTREQLRLHGNEVKRMFADPDTHEPALTAYLRSILGLPVGAGQRAVLDEMQRR
jgi:hypothetical protein